MTYLENFKRTLDAVGIVRAIVALLSAGIAHNVVFVAQLPRSLLSLIDGTLLANITLQYTIVLSAALVLIVLLNHFAAVIYGILLSRVVSRLEKKRAGQLHPLKKRDRYFNFVRYRPGWTEAVKPDKFWNICERGLSSEGFSLRFRR